MYVLMIRLERKSRQNMVVKFHKT